MEGAADVGGPAHGPLKNVIPEGPVELACKWACEVALIVMLVTGNCPVGPSKADMLNGS